MHSERNEIRIAVSLTFCLHFQQFIIISCCKDHVGVLGDKRRQDRLLTEAGVENRVAMGVFALLHRLLGVPVLTLPNRWAAI